jgi:hypothetical protein
MVTTVTTASNGYTWKQHANGNNNDKTTTTMTMTTTTTNVPAAEG